MNKAGLRQRIMDMASPTSSTVEWDTTATTGEVDLHMGIVHAREWKRILNANPYIRTNKVTPTSDASGQFLITAFTTGTGDTAKNFYRVLLVAINNVAYQEMSAKDAYMETINGGPFRAWFRDGDYIVAPDAASTVATGIWVNHTPTRADLLANDASTVVFPADYEDVLVYEAAATLLDKGSARPNEAETMRQRAEILRRDMLQDIARFSVKPMTFGFSDNAGDYAS